VSKVTSKLQVTVPKAVAERHHIKPGDEISWVEAGESLRIVPAAQAESPLDLPQRLRLFDGATLRQRRRQARRQKHAKPSHRGWTRAELYDRDRAR
jgi:AbrB family looped-hinge helix DNA binding protein